MFDFKCAQCGGYAGMSGRRINGKTRYVIACKCGAGVEHADRAEAVELWWRLQAALEAMMEWRQPGGKRKAV